MVAGIDMKNVRNVVKEKHVEGRKLRLLNNEVMKLISRKSSHSS